MENYQESLAAVSKDPIMGVFVEGAGKRGDGRVVYMEEGKKRQE